MRFCRGDVPPAPHQGLGVLLVQLEAAEVKLRRFRLDQAEAPLLPPCVEDATGPAVRMERSENEPKEREKEQKGTAWVLGGSGRPALARVSSSSRVRGRAAPLLWGSEPERATSIPGQRGSPPAEPH